MSIAQRLPYDILELIFTYCWRIKSSGKWAVIDRTDFPILLLHVCSSWRKAALSTSILWSNLALAFGESTGDLMSFDGVVDRSRILDPWVEVVGRGPKSLSLTFNWESEPVYDFVLPEASCEGIQNLWLFRSPHVIELLPEGSTLPRLETLVLFTVQGVADGRTYALPPQSASQLRKLWLQGVDPTAFLDQRQTWTHLTHLILEERVSSLSHIFHSCPQLEEAVIFLKSDSDSSIAAVDDSKLSFTHRSLAKLVLYTFFSTWPAFPAIPSYFRGWHLPALASFQVSTAMQSNKVLRDWPTLMKRMPNLREVYLGPELNYSRVNEEEIYDAFNAFNPLLDTLILDQSEDPTFSSDPYPAAYYTHPFSSVDLLRRFLLSRTTSRGTLVPIRKLVILLSNDESVIEISRSLLKDIKTNLDFLLAGNDRGGAGGGLELELSLTSISYRTLISSHGGYYSTAQQTERYLQKVMKDYSTYRAFDVE